MHSRVTSHPLHLIAVLHSCSVSIITMSPALSLTTIILIACNFPPAGTENRRRRAHPPLHRQTRVVALEMDGQTEAWDSGCGCKIVVPIALIKREWKFYSTFQYKNKSKTNAFKGQRSHFFYSPTLTLKNDISRGWVLQLLSGGN